jgi:hypothetical protein
MMNKKGLTFTGIVEIILIGVLFLLGFSLLIGGMNKQYNKNFDADMGLGLSDLANDTISSFSNLQNSFQDALGEGDANFFTASGLIVTTSYDMILKVFGVLGSFLSGSWISKAVYLMKLPSELGLILQIAYILGIGFIFLRLLFKPTGRV